MRLRVWSRWLAAVLALLAVLGSGTGLALSTGPAAAATKSSGSSGTRIYWDQNEEEDWLIHPGLQQSKPLVSPWDPNGQMAVFSDNSGNFTTGYNPTCSSQVGNLGLKKPLKMPPVGEAIWNKKGSFSGRTLAVPGPYLGGDIPGDVNSPKDCSFNNNGTYVGAAFDPGTGNFFTTDLGNAQGTVPPQDSGRLIEWFKAPPAQSAPEYSSYCILFGPTSGGDNPNPQTQHHVDGTGGLRQPGTIALDKQGDVLVPTLGVGSSLHGEVVKFAASSLPADATHCAGPSNMPSSPVQLSVFIDSTANNQASPQGIARDLTCTTSSVECWAVSSVLQGYAVAWYKDGTPDSARPPVGDALGTPQTQAQNGPSGYTPDGLAFALDGTLYFADIHISCLSSGGGEPTGGGCGPVTNQGQVLKVTFGAGSVPSTPVKVNAEADNFPVSVTACTPSTTTVCPQPG